MSYANSAVTLPGAKNRDDEITIIPDGGAVTVAVEVNAESAPAWVDIGSVAAGETRVLEYGRLMSRVRLTPAAAMEYKVLTW
jgi:hypothetical protein